MKRTICFKSIAYGLLVIFLVFSGLTLSCKKAPKEKEIAIGVILPLTGDSAESGTKVLNGIKLAIDEYNARTPKVPIKLIVVDSKANSTDGENAINKLIAVNHIKLIIGDLISRVTLAIAPIAEKNHVVILAPGSTSPKVSDAGDYIFRNWVSDNFDGEVMAKYLLGELNKKNAVIICINNEYGISLADVFEKAFLRNGGQIALEEKFDEGTSDFGTIVANLTGLKFDCMFLAGHPKESGLLVRQLREMGFGVSTAADLTVESPDFYAGAQGWGEGIIFSAPAFSVNFDMPIVKNFVKSYENKYQERPDAFAGHGYDAANIMIQAIKMAGYDLNKVKGELYKIKNFSGVTGNTTFDDHGDVSKAVLIKKLDKNGRPIMLEIYKP
jgi:branched-chain amino acid transport system substrate-binding protein